MYIRSNVYMYLAVMLVIMCVSNIMAMCVSVCAVCLYCVIGLPDVALQDAHQRMDGVGFCAGQ